MNAEIDLFANPAVVIEIALNKKLVPGENMTIAGNILIRGQRMMALKEFL